MVTDAVRDKLGKQPNPNWSVWGLGITKGGKGYDALPYAGVELNGIAGQKGILTGKVLLDGQFTETSLRDGLDQSFPIIHIASHFQFTPGSMDDSFLLRGDGSQMTLSQIKTKLNFKSVELLTLPPVRLRWATTARAPWRRGRRAGSDCATGWRQGGTGHAVARGGCQPLPH